MKPIKKLATVLTLTASALVSLSVSASEPLELRFSWWGGNSRHTKTLEAIKAFEEKYPGINIKAEYSGWDGYLTKLTTQVAGRTEPDIIQLNWSWLDMFSSRGDGFYDLSQLNNLDLGGYTVENLAPTTRNGKVHAISTSMSGAAFFYNKNTWEKAGLDYPKTWKELFNAGQVFKEKLGDDYYPLVMNEREIQVLLQSYMIQRHGQSLIDAKSKKISYNDDQLEEMFELYRKLVAEHVLPSKKLKNAYGASSIEASRQWMNGQWAGVYGPNPTVDGMQRFLAEGQTLEAGPAIQLEQASESGTFYRPAMVFSVSKESRHPEKAALFIDFMLHDKQALEILSDTRGIPLNSTAYNFLIDNEHVDKTSLNFQGFQLLESLNYKTEISPFVEEDKVVSTLKTTIESMDYKNWTAKQAAKDFRRKVDRVLKRVMRS